MVALVLGPCQAIAAESPEPSAEPRAPVPLQMAVMSLPDGQVQSAYHAMLAAEGGAKPYRWSVSDALPAGLALDADTGAITGSPSSSGQTTLTVTVTDSAPAPRSSAKQLSITVAAVAKQVQIANGSLPGGQVDATYRGLLVASGGALPYTWTILSGSLPAGLALDAATGDLTGTPATPGNYGFTVKVTSSSLFAEPATKRFSIAVAAAPAPFAPPINLPVQPDSATLPALELPASPDNATADSSGVPFKPILASPIWTTVAPQPLQIKTTSLPRGQMQVAYGSAPAGQGGTPPYTWAVFGQLPGGLSLSASTGRLSGTPTAAGEFPFIVQLADSAGQTTSAEFNINVAATPGAAALIHHVVLVVEDPGANYADVIGNPAMPFLNSLASQNSLASEFYANSHPSDGVFATGNYFMMTTGQLLSDDDSFAQPVSADNVVRQLLAAGRTWKAYAEDRPRDGDTTAPANHGGQGNPLASFIDVRNGAAQNQNLVPFSQFAADLANRSLPGYAWIAPNPCQGAQDCSLAAADAWLQANIGPLLTSPVFQDGVLLVIAFDRPGDDVTNGSGRVPVILAGPQVRKQFQSTTPYQFESLLRLTLEALGVPNWPGAAATAPSMSEFFLSPLK